jgi:hypothetical protein
MFQRRMMSKEQEKQNNGSLPPRNSGGSGYSDEKSAADKPPSCSLSRTADSELEAELSALKDQYLRKQPISRIQETDNPRERGGDQVRECQPPRRPHHDHRRFRAALKSADESGDFGAFHSVSH